MKTPSQEQREAIERLNFTKDGKLLNRFLDDALAEANLRLAMDETDRVRGIQGEARTLRELIKLLNP